ncbi:hypothetical protein DPMN_051846 [Dreissena polymorpha]|uniref:Uncharacterized protein n=1 Tax=Dreissena polymorpha TaxID=45954 RepID=A0A9D4CKR3_DREPO|nr:hypothetical protein DPMN_051846 [Dreissena polymorpha]
MNEEQALALDLAVHGHNLLPLGPAGTGKRLGARAGAVCGREGGLGLARRGCACAGAAGSAIWELQQYTTLHD